VVGLELKKVSGFAGRTRNCGSCFGWSQMFRSDLGWDRGKDEIKGLEL